MHSDFTLTRNDFALLHKRMAALNHTNAGGKGRLRGFRGAAAKVFVWFAIAIVLFGVYRAFSAESSTVRYIASAAGGFFATVCLGIVFGGKLAQRAIADDGWFLSPQSVEMSEDGVMHQFKGGRTQWAWSAFLAREESNDMHYLFVEPGQCLLVPKSALTTEAHGLIRKNVLKRKA